MAETGIYECLDDLEKKYESLILEWSISNGSYYRTATDTKYQQRFDKWDLLAAVYQQRS
jgi:hypothetical protein